MAQQPRQLERDFSPGREMFFGRGVYGPEGRRIGVLRTSRAGRPSGNQPYAIIELAGYARALSDLRAIPLSRLSYSAERGHFNCDLSEMSVRSAPSYQGAGDWLDSRWTAKLDDYFDGDSR